MTSLGRRLMLPYAVCGICILGLTVYCISALMIDEGRTVWRDLYMHKALKRAQDRRHAERTSEKRSGKQSPQDLDVNPERQERRLREQDFKRMRDIVRSLIRQFMWWSVVILALLWVSLLLLGATVFWKAERAQDWSYFQAIYFALNALLVIGYGDLLLQSEGGKAFFVVWSLIAVPIVTALISATARAAGQTYLQEKNGPKGPLLRRWSTWSSKKQEVQRLPHNVISGKCFEIRPAQAELTC
jgi:potassium channel subfamily K, other eukaryote